MMVVLMKNIKINMNLNMNTLVMVSIMILEVLFFMDKFGVEVPKEVIKTDLVVDAVEIVDDKISKELSIDELKLGLATTTARKVMFVAHPDDETLWGGNGLYHEKYLVVCMTCGVDDRRVEEFRSVMESYGDDFIMLGYPDLVKNKKSDWQDDWTNINYDVQSILSLKKWDGVVTHNPEGEYGHIHHKLTSNIVTSHCDTTKLNYFGRFYWGEVPEGLYVLNEEEFVFKTTNILPLYVTQYGAIENLKNMIYYETWISYSDWYGE